MAFFDIVLAPEAVPVINFYAKSNLFARGATAGTHILDAAVHLKCYSHTIYKIIMIT